jgi:hypothetical protein
MGHAPSIDPSFPEILDQMARCRRSLESASKWPAANIREMVIPTLRG